VGHRGPETHRGEPLPRTVAVQDAGDPGRSLVARGRETQILDEGRVLRVGGDRDRPRVRHVGQERSERDHELHVELASEFDYPLRKRLPPEVRLGPREQDRAPVPQTFNVRLGGRKVVPRPLYRPGDALDELDLRPYRLVIEKVLAVEARETFPPPGLSERA